MIIDIIIAFISFILISIILYTVNVKKIVTGKGTKKRKKAAKEIIEIRYLMITYNLKKEKLLNKKFILIISLLDALIITGTFLIIMLFKLSILWQLMIGFVLLMGFIYAIYNILGRILVKKGYDK